MDQLTKAIDELPTYVGLGPVFPTSTKPGAESVGLDYIKNAADYLQDKSVAHVAIGGITAENVSEVIKAGANAVAVCSAITHVPNPVKACQNLRRKIEDSLP
jgi:thiamine-phosphate pyrophosphorylase